MHGITHRAREDWAPMVQGDGAWSKPLSRNPFWWDLGWDSDVTPCEQLEQNQGLVSTGNFLFSFLGILVVLLKRCPGVMGMNGLHHPHCSIPTFSLTASSETTRLSICW